MYATESTPEIGNRQAEVILCCAKFLRIPSKPKRQATNECEVHILYKVPEIYITVFPQTLAISQWSAAAIGTEGELNKVTL